MRLIIDYKSYLKNNININNITGCWDWVKYVDNKGYGKMRHLGKVARCHRISYMVFNGDIDPGMHILHSCNNRRCVNPDHLRQGTNMDNVLDRVKSGNHLNVPRGESNHQAKLTEKDVLEIRRLHDKEGYSQVSLGKMFNLHQTTISLIVRRMKWRHV